MRKLVIGALAGLILVLPMAAVAVAQRDPFDPVISQAELTGDGTGATGDGTGTEGTGSTDANGADLDGTGTNGLGENGADALANTGAETEPWLVAAYALIAVGAGAVAVSRVNGQAI